MGCFYREERTGTDEPVGDKREQKVRHKRRDQEHPTFAVYCKGVPTGQIIGSMEEKEFIDQLKMLIENADKCKPGTPIDEE